MSRMSREELWGSLAAASLVEGEPPSQSENVASPWYVRVMLGFAGWIGALFLLAFVFIAISSLMKNVGAMLALGSITCLGAALILNNLPDNDFGIQFGIALSFAGQALFIFGLLSIFKNADAAALFCVALFEAVLVMAVNNPIHRVVSACAAAMALSFAMAGWGALYFALPLIMAGVAILWLNEANWSLRENAARYAGYGLVLAAMYVNSALIMRELLWMYERFRHGFGDVPVMFWLGTIGLCVVFLATIIALFRREGARFDILAVKFALFAALAIAAISFKALGIITGLLIVLLGFANGNRVLWGLGVLALIVYLSQYYYMLQETLLVKAGVLLATGAVMLGLRLLLRLVCSSTRSTEGHHA